MNSTKIKKQYIINGKTFDNLQDAEKYRDKLNVESLKDYPTSSFDEIVYIAAERRRPPILIGG